METTRGRPAKAFYRQGQRQQFQHHITCGRLVALQCSIHNTIPLFCHFACRKHRVIILLERAWLHNRIGRNLCKFFRPECATSQCDCSLIG